MRRLLDGVFQLAGCLAALCVLAICVAMAGQSVLREFGVPTGPTNDAVAWLCAAAAFLGMAHTFKHGDFVRVTLLLDKLPVRAARALEVSSLGIGCAAVGYLTWWATRFTWESWEFREMASGMLAIPLWIPQTSFALGSWLLLLAFVDELVIVLRGGRPTYVAAVEQRHAAGDFSSDV